MSRGPDTSYRLLWAAGAVIALLCVAAFVLWGLGGPSILFDMVAAFCS